MKFKNITGAVYAKLQADSELLTLIGLSSDSNNSNNQILLDKYPSNLKDNNTTKLLVYENQPITKDTIEIVNLQIDIYIHKSIDERNTKLISILNRLYCLLDSLDIEGYRLQYSTRLPNLPIENNDWIKYGIVFKTDLV
ncbi:hypothetical protein PV797_04920 [Clostridiaceae bacterium M8S5]|nr:hypothetical protein PV797_04920 [Clostridiaceae bacterium M8S5]